MKHIPIACIYGFISLLSYMKSDYTTVSFHTVSIIIGWIILLSMIFTLDWFDKVTDGYFIFTILFFFAARLAKYNTPEIATEASYVAIGVGLGVVVNSFHKKHLDTGLLMLGILLLEFTNISIDTDIKSVDFMDLIK